MTESSFPDDQTKALLSHTVIHSLMRFNLINCPKKHSLNNVDCIQRGKENGKGIFSRPFLWKISRIPLGPAFIATILPPSPYNKPLFCLSHYDVLSETVVSKVHCTVNLEIRVMMFALRAIDTSHDCSKCTCERNKRHRRVMYRPIWKDYFQLYTENWPVWETESCKNMLITRIMK